MTFHLKTNPLELWALPARQDNYIYILRAKDQVGVVDPGEAKPVLEWCEKNQVRITHIFCTHHHLDHVDGVPEIKAQHSNAKVYCSAHDLSRIAGADLALQEGSPFLFAQLEIEPIMIPGHTLGHMALYLNSPGWLFCGDTLFGLGCGRLFEGTALQLRDSLLRLCQLPPSTLLFWGHEYTRRNLAFALKQAPNDLALKARAAVLLNNDCTLPGRLDEEIRTNPFLQAPDLEAFAHLRELRNHF